MEPKHIEIVRHTFDQLRPMSHSVAALFYKQLFELDPSVEHLFHSDMRVQGRKLMEMLTIIIEELDHAERLSPRIQSLGKRHVHYGVLPVHYTTVGTALLGALEEGLGDVFTDATRAAWTQVYSLIAQQMQDAATGSFCS